MKDYTAIIISILSVLFTGAGLFFNYRMRKKDFQSMIFNKQFQSCSEILAEMDMNFNRLSELYHQYNSVGFPNDEFINKFWEERNNFYHFFAKHIHFLQDEIINIIIAYDADLIKFIESDVEAEETKKYFNENILKHINNLHTEFRKQFAIEKLSDDTFNLLTQNVINFNKYIPNKKKRNA